MKGIPPYLKKGDTIGITCPAGYMDREKAQTCIDTLQRWGFEVMVGNTLGSNSKTYFSGTDVQRRDEFQAMLDDDSIKAILCGRGGYGVGRIIDQLDFSRFRRKPKWIIGFSDITVFHCHIFNCFGVATLHAPMAAAFNNGGNRNAYIQSLKDAVMGTPTHYSCKAHRLNNDGLAKGTLVGGNLALFTHCLGTASEVDTRGKILFLEDIGEYHYNVDRMMYQLKRSGKLSKLAGLIVGGFTDMKDTERPFGKKVYPLIHELVKGYQYPVCYGFPVSHGKQNYALKVGVEYTLQVGSTVSLIEKL